MRSISSCLQSRFVLLLISMPITSNPSAIALVASFSPTKPDEPVITKVYEIREDLFDIYFSETVLNSQDINPVTQGYLYVKDYSGEFSDAIIV